MVALRNWPKGAEYASFGFAIFVFALVPNEIGYQDLSALIRQNPPARMRPQAHLIASPFGTIHAAMFTLPRPIGTDLPEQPRVRLASFDPNDDVTGTAGKTLSDRPPIGLMRIFSTINRALKGDREVPHAATEGDGAAAEPAAAVQAPEEFPEVQADILAAIERDKEAVAKPAPRGDEIEAAMRFQPFPEYDISLSLEAHPQIRGEEPLVIAKLDPADLYPTAPPSLDGLNAEVKDARLYFGTDLFGAQLGAIEPWAPGEEPILLFPRAPSDMPVPSAAVPTVSVPSASVPAATIPTPEAGVTVAAKGEVTRAGQGPLSPAERLNLNGDARVRAEKCLTNAIYYEARGEPVRGQIAVAQVVMNRVFSGYYPSDVCGVIYQDAQRYMTCQFTFACNGRPKVVTEPDAFERAQRIAKETLDGKLWLPEVGKSTHYHASYVHPWWARTMFTYARIGVHIFYRPRLWGDGADKPIWGSPVYTAETAAKMQSAIVDETARR